MKRISSNTNNIYIINSDEYTYIPMNFKFSYKEDINLTFPEKTFKYPILKDEKKTDEFSLEKLLRIFFFHPAKKEIENYTIKNLLSFRKNFYSLTSRVEFIYNSENENFIEKSKILGENYKKKKLGNILEGCDSESNEITKLIEECGDKPDLILKIRDCAITRKLGRREIEENRKIILDFYQNLLTYKENTSQVPKLYSP